MLRSSLAEARRLGPARAVRLPVCLSQDPVFVTVHDDQSERMQWSNMWACVCPKFFPSDPPPPHLPPSSPASVLTRLLRASVTPPHVKVSSVAKLCVCVCGVCVCVCVCVCARRLVVPTPPPPSRNPRPPSHESEPFFTQPLSLIHI